MKTTLSAIIVVISLGISAFAADSPYRFEYTVTYKDGTKLQGSTSFLTDDSIDIPIHMDTLGMCVLNVAG
ncbi:MAG: hypothetical protein WC657_08370, partial [Candidatus Paceibacterota bacterium]